MCYNLYMEETEELKKPISMRLSGEGLELITAIGKKFGVNRTAVIEMAVRKMAEQEGITSSTTKNSLKK